MSAVSASFFFDGAPLEPGAAVTLGEEVAHHARVRRIDVGETIRLLDGRGARSHATVLRVAKRELGAEVLDVERVEPPPPVHLLVPVADRERMLWLAEKATELGAASWRPVLWSRSRSVSPRGEGPAFADKVRARMRSALEQSGGAWLPEVHAELPPDRAVDAVEGGARLLLDAGGAPILEHRLAAPLVLAIGPEGGLEEEERAWLVERGFRRARLAGNVLRFETAAVAALAVARAALLT